MTRTTPLDTALLLPLAVSLLAFAASCTAQEGESPFSNVEILTEVTDKREMRSIMKEQAKALGVKCTYCHVQGQFELDDKPEKREGRDMMRLVRDVNAKWFASHDVAISCWTCHRGAEHPESTRPEAEALPEPAPENETAFENVKVLTGVTDKRVMRAIMKEQAKALGVKCTGCHVQGQFALDDKEPKLVARDMMRMVEELNASYFAEHDSKISCWTCHQGSEHPELTRPEGEGSAPIGFEAAE